MRRLDHVGIYVHDIDATKRFLCDVLGLEVGRAISAPELGLCAAFLRSGAVDIELLELTDRQALRRKLGPGVSARIDHLAFEVPDLAEIVGRFADEGILLRGQPGRYEVNPEPLFVDSRLSLWADTEQTGGIAFQFVQPIPE